MSDPEANARHITLELLRRTTQGGFRPTELRRLKDAMIAHVEGGGSLDKSLTIVNPSLGNSPDISLTLTIAMPKEEPR